MSRHPGTAHFGSLTDTPSLAALVAEDLRTAILRGTLRPGQRVSDVRLATEMGISRAPVREAIRQLAARGLVKEVPRRGAFVTHITRAVAHEIYECRRALEGLAARRLAEATPVGGAIEPLEDILREMARLSDADPIARADVDHRFHFTLCKMTNNSWLMRLYEQISDQSRLIHTLDSLGPVRSSDYDLAAMHGPILEAISTGEPNAAEASILAHIDLAERLFISEIPDLDEGSP